jgi:poly(glycerol-phosphate) alpha-glucosyltransferase
MQKDFEAGSRIVFFLPDILGGVKSVVTNLSMHMRRDNISHHIFLYTYHNGLKNYKTVEEDSITTHLKISRNSTAHAAYKFLTEDVRPTDIIVSNDTLELEAINFSKLANRIIYYLHGDLKHYDDTLKHNEHIIDAVLCVSSGLKDKYGALYPKLPFFISYPIVKDFKGVRQTKPLPLEAFFVGRLDGLKGADTIFEVITRSIDEKLPIKWSIYTSSWGSDKKIMESLPKQANLFIDTKNPEVLKALENATVLVFPSRSEGFGVAVMEAMKRGVVPICRPIPIGIPDMVIENETGFYASDTDSFMSVLKRLVADQSEIERVSKRTMAFSNDKFEETKIKEMFYSNLETVNKLKAVDKTFVGHKKLLAESLLPENTYRLFKLAYSRLKHKAK